MNIAIAQMEVIPGRPDKNVPKILKEAEAAKGRKVDIIFFPELAVSGYLNGDEWENDSFIKDLVGYNRDILEKSDGIAIFWGNVFAEFDKNGEDGRTRKYNAVYVAQDRKWVNNGVFDGHSFKSLMPKYREFDDERHFYSLPKLAAERGVALEQLLKPFPIKTKDKTVNIGAILCEDMWWPDYSVNPTHILVKNGADIIVNLSASPWTWRKNDKRHEVVRNLLKSEHKQFIYVNNVGIQNNGKNIFLFDGNSTVYNSDGTLSSIVPDYQEKTVDVSLPSRNKIELPERKPYDDEDIAELHKGLIYGIRKFFESIGMKRAVIGLSGGIDSAVDACLLTEALGKENVYAINMPSNFNSEITKEAAFQLAKNLGIHYSVISIQDSVDLTVNKLQNAGFPVDSLGLENIQSRDRGSTLLAAISQSLEAVFISNGNKTEVAFGYATLYGDITGALGPLQDVYKGEVYKLGRFYNEKTGWNVIPDDSFNLPPSAELSPDQDVTKGKGDPIIYPIHDMYVKAFVEFRRDPEYLLGLYMQGKLEEKLNIPKGLINKHFPTAAGFVNDLEDKWITYKKMVFKRIPGVPNIVVSKRAFGFDLREAQNEPYFTRRYHELKKELLGK